MWELHPQGAKMTIRLQDRRLPDYFQRRRLDGGEIRT